VPAPARPLCRVGPEASHSLVLLALRRHQRAYEARYGSDSARTRVLRRLVACRTEALGSHLCVCEACGWKGFAPNSCRDRHCPQCQGAATAQWLKDRTARMLSVPHFQVVFTLPAELRAIAYDNPELLYGLLFATAASVLQDLAAQRLGAQLGITAVLHTWTSELLYHPHVHCLVTGGGLDPDGQRFIASREDYLFPGKILGAMFRGRFLEGLIDAFERDELTLRGDDRLAAEMALRSTLRALSARHARWVVHVEPPRGRPAEHVAKYLARYVKRVAISDARIVEVTDSEVAFRSRRSIVRVQGVEFARRFLLHVLPAGFRKIRHYGLYAPGNAKHRLQVARALVIPGGDAGDDAEQAKPEVAEAGAHTRLETCPECGERRVRRIVVLPVGGARWPRGPP